MSGIKKISGRALPLRGQDIDTDRIIPARFLRSVTFDGLGEHAFADDRSQLKAAGRQHAFDNPAYAGAGILVAGSNFGCGSSREHAPQSLQKWGLSAVVAVSFAEIFFNNSLAIGLPCVCLAPADLEKLQALIEADPQLLVEVDLAALQVRAGELRLTARIPEGARQMLLRGLWDATAQLLSHLGRVRQRVSAIPYLNGFSRT
jgi:3-isopropylmalate/(R)-2-methylmalate dehydratase small subunit